MRLSSWKIRLVIGYTGAAAGTCFLLLAVGCAVYEASFLTRSLEAQGTVIANVGSQIRESTQQTFCPQFQYESEDGSVQTITSSACSSPPTFSVADKIHIHYLRSHPESGQIDSYGAKWGLALGFGIACGVLLPIGVFLLNGLRSQGYSLDPLSFWD
jgi:Protein of unknown function (DUF3592)